MRILGFLSAAGLAAAIVVLPAGRVSAGLFDSVLSSQPQRSQVVARHLVSFPPGYEPGTIYVQFSRARLYYVLSNGRAISYPIATPKGEARWSGETRVSAKKVNPGWTPTAEMRRENPDLPAYVPGGHPQNPLGVRALYLGKSLYRIHGTDAPWSVGQSVSHGCIRMFNQDVADLYQRVPIGTRVVVTW
ncbi:L,D-transpeptidase [Methyloceanibacter methanicus]|uniref:L,D-transpeptidase n=1 Tax=Methyloceanibacter methanicus TaxID=1774968 RepID=UPI000849BC9F|nr:L,D-transpeptidase [Methyloceanibacter methanicus]